MSTKIANPDALGDTLDAIEEKRQSRKDERLELQGTARDLFVARYEDTFEIDRKSTRLNSSHSSPSRMPSSA